MPSKKPIYSLVVMMTAVNPWKAPQALRNQLIEAAVFCALVVCISDISGIYRRHALCRTFSSSPFNNLSPDYAIDVHRTAGKDPANIGNKYFDE
jgi:hypothetical protein